MQEIARLKSPRGPAGPTVEKEPHFFTGEAGRMNSQEVPDRSWPIASGAVESACRQSQRRFKGPAQFWTQPGFRHLYALDEARQNDHWDELWRPC